MLAGTTCPPLKAKADDSVVRRGALVALLNLWIALTLTAFGVQLLEHNLVYSFAIGFSIWALIELALRRFVTDARHQMRRLLLVVPAAGLLGYIAGSLFGDLVFGFDTWSEVASHPRRTIGFLVLSLTAGAVATWFFASRQILAATRLAEEEAQRRATEARLKLLETQLEPHLLFNTLANLRALIALDPPRAQAMLDHTIAYLRATLDASRSPLHPLRIEFERLRDYLEIMAVRMGPRLRFMLELPSAAATVPVPPLLLQPLVENAIRHGLEPKVEGGTLRVAARIEADAVVIEIADTGTGCPAAVCAALADPTAPATPAGFGLQQVRERLTTLYGRDATLAIAADPGLGTCVSVRLPLATALPAPEMGA